MTRGSFGIAVPLTGNGPSSMFVEINPVETGMLFVTVIGVASAEPFQLMLALKTMLVAVVGRLVAAKTSTERLTALLFQFGGRFSWLSHWLVPAAVLMLLKGSRK